MTTLPVTEARKNFSDLVNRVAFQGERVKLQRNGKVVAALVPAEEMDLLEAMEDQADLVEVRNRLMDNQAPLSYAEARKTLGLE